VADEVVNSSIAESQNASTPVVENASVTDNESDITTWKKRLAGKDQALTATKKELDEIKVRAEELSRWKAEQELTSMTEIERAQAKIRDLEQKAATAEQTVKEERLAREYPLAYQFLKDTSGLDDVSRAAALESFVKQASSVGRTAEPEPAPVDPNNARRVTAAPIDKPTSKSISQKLKDLGNPFAE
jgi:TolA-binding protein